MTINFRKLVLAGSFAMILAVRGRAEAGGAVRTAGDAAALLLPATAGVATLYLKDYTGTKEFLESAALSLGVTLALKYTVNERRPNGEEHSFPSAHTTISFSSAEFIRKRYGWEYGLPAYAAAGFVGYSRIEAREHYFKDVLAGAAIGMVSSYIFTDPYSKLNISGEAGPGYFGLKVGSAW